eukprot:763046-Hanusia_phi.AAC.4
MENVDVAEYNKALRENPEICRPFVSEIGDMRSGEELLSDCNRDCLFNECFESWTKSEEVASACPLR